MDVKKRVGQIINGLVPETVRIVRKKRRKEDVIRDGRWLARLIRADQGSMEPGPIVSTNLDSWMVLPVDTWKREQKEEYLLDKYLFSFDTMLIIRNPYGRTPLCCLVLFMTEKECFVRYTVKGNTTDCDLTYTTSEPVRRHRIPLMGLYASCVNRVEIELLNTDRERIARKRLEIPTGGIPEKLMKMVKPVLSPDDPAMPFVFVTGGISGATYAFDKNGDVRYYLSRTPKQYGIYPTPDGRFLFPERHINRPTYINPHANVMYDMDLLGRAKETYYVPGGIHHWAEVLPGSGGRIIVAAASSLEDRMEDLVIRYDRNLGKIIRKYDLGQYFPTKFQNRCDWAHLNRVFCCGQQHILISMRNLHTVAKIDLKSGEMVWILAHPDLYKGTELEPKVLRPVGKAFHYFFQQHAVEEVHTAQTRDIDCETMEIMLFDNHCCTKRKVSWFDQKDQSYICFYRINERDLTVETTKVFPCALSPTRSNAWFDGEKRRVFAMAGAACAGENRENALIYEWDYDTGQELGRFEIRQGFFKAFPFKIQDRSLEKRLDVKRQFRKGELEMPVPCAGDKKAAVSNLPKLPPRENLVFAYMDDLVLVRAQDHRLEKIFFCGDTIWERDFTDTYQKSEVFAAKIYYVAVPVNGLRAGKYQIAVQYDGNQYRTGKWFERR